MWACVAPDSRTRSAGASSSWRPSRRAGRARWRASRRSRFDRSHFGYAPGGSTPGHRRRPVPAAGHAGVVLDIRFARPVGRSSRHCRRRGLSHPDTGPGRRHPPRAPGSRSARGSPDGNGQDRGLRAPDPRPDAAARQHQLLPGAPPGSRPDPRPYPRAGDAGRRQRPDVRPDRAAPLDRGLRRHPDRAADQGPPHRRRDPRRDPRPAARPRRPADGQSRRRRDPGPRRGRPDARHGLPARHPADPRAAPGAPPEPALLGDLLAGDPATSRRPS